MNPAIRQRQAIERAIVTKIIDGLLAAGHAISVDNGADDETPRSVDKAAILAAMFQTDEETIFVHENRRGPKRPLGWVKLVYGNDGFDVISDYSVNLGAVLMPANELSNWVQAGGLITGNEDRDAAVKRLLAVISLYPESAAIAARDIQAARELLKQF